MLEELEPSPVCRTVRSGSPTSRRDLHRRLEGHQRRRHHRRGGWHAGSAGHHRRRRRQGSGLCAACRGVRGKVRDAVLIGRDGRLAARRSRGVHARVLRLAGGRGGAAAMRPGPATPCCCRPPARASTCSATTPIAARSRRGAGARGMNSRSPHRGAMPSRRPRGSRSRAHRRRDDRPGAGDLLLGLVMVTSASITIAGQEGDPFDYLERQLLLCSPAAPARC